MKKHLNFLLDNYYTIFIIVTLVYTVPFLIPLSTLLNLILFGLGIILIGANMTTIKAFITCNILSFIFIIITLLSIIIKNENYLQNFKLTALAILQLFVLLNFNRFDKNPKRTINVSIKIIIIFSVIVSALSLFVYFFNINFTIYAFKIGKFANDLTGFYVHPNTAGFVSSLSLVLSFIVYIYTEKKIMIANMALQLIVMILANSNASILLCIVFFALYAINKFAFKRGHKSYAITPFFIEGGFYDDVINYFANGRFELWYTGFLVIKNNFLLGVGPANTASAGRYYGKIEGYSAIDNGGFHNSYIELMAGVGFLGFVTLIIIIVRKLKLLYRSENKEHIIMFMFCLAILVYSLFESKLFFQASLLPVIFWIMLGMV